MPIKSLFILSLLFILIGCGDSEIAEEKNNEIYQQRAYASYDEACDKFNMTQTELNFCSNEIAEEIDKEIIELSKNSEDFSLEDFKEWAGEAIDQEYPCQDPVADIGIEKLVFLNIMFYCEPEIYGGSGPQNNVDPDVCKNYTDNKKRIELRESETDRMFDDNGKCLEQIDYGSIQPLSNSLFYIQKGEEYKQMIRDRQESEALIEKLDEQEAEIWRMVEENTTHTEAWYAKAAQMREQAQKEAEEKSLREIRKAEVERSQQLEEENQFVFETEPPVDCLEDLREDSDNMVGYDYEDYCVYKATAGNIITIDVRVKEGENQTIFDIPYSGIRHSGILIQVYYNAGPFGKSQWFLLPYTKGIMLMPNSITLPINQWVSDGLTVGGWIRVVILTSEKN